MKMAVIVIKKNNCFVDILKFFISRYFSLASLDVEYSVVDIKCTPMRNEICYIYDM